MWCEYKIKINGFKVLSREHNSIEYFGSYKIDKNSRWFLFKRDLVTRNSYVSDATAQINYIYQEIKNTPLNANLSNRKRANVCKKVT